MSGYYTPLIGRFGNQCFQYAHARALAWRHGEDLVTPDWIGQSIFEIEKTRPKEDGDTVLGGYCQNQESLLYTRKQVKEWFKFRPEFEESLAHLGGKMLAHRRVGDYQGYGYPVLSKIAYRRAARQFGYDSKELEFVCEEEPVAVKGLKKEWAFLPDFYRMAKASVLFRGNSSFSWWAATLCDGKIFSPVIHQLKHGKEHDDVPFVPGNWPKLANLPDITDLHLREDDNA